MTTLPVPPPTIHVDGCFRVMSKLLLSIPMLELFFIKVYVSTLYFVFFLNRRVAG
jgi:hypothetical protein